MTIFWQIWIVQEINNTVNVFLKHIQNLAEDII